MLLYIGFIDLTNTHESKVSGNNPKVSLAHFDDGEKKKCKATTTWSGKH